MVVGSGKGKFFSFLLQKFRELFHYMLLNIGLTETGILYLFPYNTFIYYLEVAGRF